LTLWTHHEGGWSLPAVDNMWIVQWLSNQFITLNRLSVVVFFHYLVTQKIAILYSVTFAQFWCFLATGQFLHNLDYFCHFAGGLYAYFSFSIWVLYSNCLSWLL